MEARSKIDSLARKVYGLKRNHVAIGNSIKPFGWILFHFLHFVFNGRVCSTLGNQVLRMNLYWIVELNRKFMPIRFHSRDKCYYVRVNGVNCHLSAEDIDVIRHRHRQRDGKNAWNFSFLLALTAAIKLLAASWQKKTRHSSNFN